jgi:Zn-dependent protease
MQQDPTFSSPPESPSTPIIYPPKPQLEDKKGNVWIRSLVSLALYLVIGYYFFRADWVLLLILTAIVIFHELGHFLAMKMYHYTDLGIFFIPLLGAYASGTKREISQKQSAIILLAGPMPGIILGVILFLILKQFGEMPYGTYDHLRKTAGLLLFLNVLNLLPIYPLDGGQLLNRLFLDESKVVGKIFVILSAAALTWLALFGLGRPFYPLLVFPAMMLLRLRADRKYDQLTKKIEEQGINLEKTYEELSDEEYWKIRNIVIENNHSALRTVNPAPPYEYAVNEDKVVAAVENVLQRTIIQDLSWAGKLLIILTWAACFAVPFILNLVLPFLKSF